MASGPISSVQFSCSVVSNSLRPHEQASPCQASLSIANSWSPPKPMSMESVMPSNHLILCCPLLLLPSIFPSIRVFSNESALHIRWPKYWSFSFNISPSNGHRGLIFVGKVLSLLFNMLSRLVITFLPRSKRFLISWLQSPSAVILEPKKIKPVTVSIVSPSICHEVMGLDTMILVFWMLSFKPTFSLSPFSLWSRGSRLHRRKVQELSVKILGT